MGTVPSVIAPAAVRRARSVGLAGSALLLVASWGIGPYRVPSGFDTLPLLGWLRTTYAGRTVSSLLFFAGVVLLVSGWLLLGRAVREGAVGRVQDLWRTAAWWSAPLLAGLPLGSRDVYSYLAQGRLAGAGIDPYTHGPASLPGPLLDAVSVTWWLTPAPYGPVFVAVSERVDALGEWLGAGRVVAGVLVMRLLVVACVVALAVLVVRLARTVGADPLRATWLAVLNPLLLVHLLSGLHNEALVVPLLLAALAVSLGRHPVLGALLVAVAAAVKVTAVVVLPFVALLWVLRRGDGRVRTLLGAGVVVAALCGGVLTALSMLSGHGFAWVSAIGASTRHGSRLSVVTALSDGVGAALGPLVGTARATDLAHLLVLAGLAAAGLATAWLVLRPVSGPDGPRLVLLRSGVAAGLLALLGPVLHPWYVLPALALVAVGGATPALAGAAGRASRRVGEVALWLTVVLACTVRGGGSEVLRGAYPLDLALGISAALVLAVVVVRTGRPRVPRVLSPADASPYATIGG